MNKLTVVDFFCGAGGFSEGFRQKGFEIINGYDNWKPAVETFNYNLGTGKAVLKNILDFKDIKTINNISNTDVILGSPPCVSFSSSNFSGKADKSLGIELIETFLKIVAVKKFQTNSILKAWFMENVSKSLKYLPDFYSFSDLNLSEWASDRNLDPNSVAIKIKDNFSIINSADYGSPQVRKRAIVGEIIGCETLPIPPKTHFDIKAKGQSNLFEYHKLRDLKNALPPPNKQICNGVVKDPFYKNLNIKDSELTDHYYDTGLYECEWKGSAFLKINHPYMGKMSFPENEDRPSRTITATKIGSSREALIFKSEYNRVGDGEYRTPTVREAACLMSFPITYQFLGSIGTKWRLVGNAVCPKVSCAFAGELLNRLAIDFTEDPTFKNNIKEFPVNNLNSFFEATFGNPPKKKTNSRFRRHPFKDGNLTVTLSNYDITEKKSDSIKWLTSVQYGTGDGFPSIAYEDNFYKTMEPIIASIEHGHHFIQTTNNGMLSKIGSKNELQYMYENQISLNQLLEPTALVEYVAQLIEKYNFEDSIFKQDEVDWFKKNIIPKKQIFALYALNKIASIANKT